MSLRSITVFIELNQIGVRRMTYAVTLARRHDAHLVGIFVAPAQWAGNPAESFVRGHGAIHALIERHNKRERAAAIDATAAFRSATAQEDISVEFRILRDDVTGEEVLLHSLHTDIIIIGRPNPGSLSQGWSAERLLLATGIPSLIVPDDWKQASVAERILVGWNASREARRAIADVRPLLAAAREVFVVVVDPRDNSRLGEEPGADIGHYLSRYGAHVTIDRISSDGGSVAGALLAHAKQVGADLIVLGAYSHNRAREIVFGGVTQSLVSHSQVPLLMSH